MICSCNFFLLALYVYLDIYHYISRHQDQKVNRNISGQKNKKYLHPKYRKERAGIPLTQSKAIKELTLDLISFIVFLLHIIPELVSFKVRANNSWEVDISSTIYS